MIELPVLADVPSAPAAAGAPARGKLFIQTHGCQMNEYDSARMADVLAASEGLELTANVEEADVVLVNTCSIREKAQEKVFSQLGRWRLLKEERLRSEGREVIIGVGGCVASQEGEAIIRRAPFVDLVFGPQTLHRLPELIRARREQKRPQVDISFPEIEKFDRLPKPRAEGPSAFVSIMEGCSKYCSFCVVPYTRGTEISRPFEDVLVEIVQLAGQGVREVNLLGQNVNAYRGDMGNGEIADLGLLIRTIAQIDGIDRIRFTTSHPLEFSDSLVEAYRDVPQLANYLHLPVQSGSDRILAAMKRGYTAIEFKQKIRRLREVRPDISISSDFIVGFPGETEADFEADPRMRRLLTECPVLAELKLQVDKHRRLSHDEQVVLIHTLGHMPGGPQAVNYLLQKCVDVAPDAGLVFELAEAEPSEPRQDSVRVAETEPLSSREAESLLSRLPALQLAEDDEKEFSIRPQSPPPPRAGKTERAPFPPKEDGEAAPEVSGPLAVVRFSPEGEVVSSRVMS